MSFHKKEKRIPLNAGELKTFNNTLKAVRGPGIGKDETESAPASG